ncbi:MAG: FKBP-type peptidyl-prolyl cis-trans isomerase, partial [Telluria sp.]
YTLWLYSGTASDRKGVRLEQNTFSFKLGTNAVIPGFDQGVTGMKVGGKRTIEVPSSLGYGASGTSGVPPNTGLVFEIVLNSVETTSANANDPAALVKTDNTVGTGAEAVSGSTADVTYTLWLYSASAADHKGTRMESNSFSFKLGANAVIPGFEQGVTGMKVGGKRTIEVPSSLGYGATGSSGVPPNTGLVFEIVLNKVG